MDELLSLRELCRELDLPEPDEAESERMSRMTRVHPVGAGTRGGGDGR